MLFLTVLDTYHMFSVVHKIIRLDDAWFGFATVSGSDGHALATSAWLKSAAQYEKETSADSGSHLVRCRNLEAYTYPVVYVGMTVHELGMCPPENPGHILSCHIMTEFFIVKKVKEKDRRSD
ncbi:hypothetical protein GRJ2_000892700 [Grus japonensis]|uniref:Uncharacterized protein n=1 Tax=Grus japonensis TaxID=30415 RepID=A0ABC9WFM1_GRUJA